MKTAKINHMIPAAVKKNNIATIKQTAVPKELLNNCSELLQQGKIIIAPTETRYGMLVDASQASALELLYQVKGRPKEMPMALFLASVTEIGRIAEFPEMAKKLAGKFLPGPLTLVLQANSRGETGVVKNGNIGIRVSSEPFIQSLLKKVDFPLTATSANRSGGTELTTTDEIAEQFGDTVSLYIDNGILDRATSTVVQVTSGGFKILRQGAITEQEILETIG